MSSAPELKEHAALSLGIPDVTGNSVFILLLQNFYFIKVHLFILTVNICYFNAFKINNEVWSHSRLQLVKSTELHYSH